MRDTQNHGQLRGNILQSQPKFVSTFRCNEKLIHNDWKYNDELYIMSINSIIMSFLQIVIVPFKKKPKNFAVVPYFMGTDVFFSILTQFIQKSMIYIFYTHSFYYTYLVV